MLWGQVTVSGQRCMHAHSTKNMCLNNEGPHNTRRHTLSMHWKRRMPPVSTDMHTKRSCCSNNTSTHCNAGRLAGQGYFCYHHSLCLARQSLPTWNWVENLIRIIPWRLHRAGREGPCTRPYPLKVLRQAEEALRAPSSPLSSLHSSWPQHDQAAQVGATAPTE